MPTGTHPSPFGSTLQPGSRGRHWGAAHHAEVQEITELFVGAHRCHSLRLVHRLARATGVGTGVGSPGLETALCGDTRDRWGERYETMDK